MDSRNFSNSNYYYNYIFIGGGNMEYLNKLVYLIISLESRIA